MIVVVTFTDASTQIITYVASNGKTLTTRSVNWANLTKVLFEFKSGANTAYGTIDDLIILASITMVPATSVAIVVPESVTAIKMWESL